MIRLYEFIIYGHFHKWEIIESGKLSMSSMMESEATGTRYQLQCEKCGNIKKVDLI